ncbi:MAG: hypothetical protein WC606_03810 [Candidatus Absconditabacterales bacterium]|jgi:hypothetical protein
MTKLEKRFKEENPDLMKEWKWNTGFNVILGISIGIVIILLGCITIHTITQKPIPLEKNGVVPILIFLETCISGIVIVICLVHRPIGKKCDQELEEKAQTLVWEEVKKKMNNQFSCKEEEKVKKSISEYYLIKKNGKLVFPDIDLSKEEIISKEGYKVAKLQYKNNEFIFICEV